VAVATQVAVTKVVGQDYDDVRTRRGGQAEGKARKQGQQQGSHGDEKADSLANGKGVFGLGLGWGLKRASSEGDF
jgi:hypothetical protein